jgi:hypothetical protein
MIGFMLRVVTVALGLWLATKLVSALRSERVGRSWLRLCCWGL